MYLSYWGQCTSLGYIHLGMSRATRTLQADFRDVVQTGDRHGSALPDPEHPCWRTLQSIQAALLGWELHCRLAVDRFSVAVGAEATGPA